MPNVVSVYTFCIAQLTSFAPVGLVRSNEAIPGHSRIGAITLDFALTTFLASARDPPTWRMFVHVSKVLGEDMQLFNPKL
jgi:hypothetical protein